ncbi:MAG: hypothetical protein ACR2HF_03120, partial [Methylococcaceae bacterium]
MPSLSDHAFSWVYALGWAVVPTGVFKSLQNENLRLKTQLIQSQNELEQSLSAALLQANEPAPVQVIEAIPAASVAPVPQPIRSADQLLQEIQKLSSWDKPQEMRLMMDELRQFYPERVADGEKRVKTGKDIKTKLDELDRVARKEGVHSAQTQKLFTDFVKRYHYLKDKARKNLDNIEAAQARRTEEQNRKKTGTLTQVRARQHAITPVTPPKVSPVRQAFAPIPETPLHAQDIRGLRPSTNWVLLIDETGSQFGEEAQQLSTNDRKLGRWVGLLMPESDHGLNDLRSGWHATDECLSEIDRVVQCVLDAQVGVFGLSVQQLPLTTGERWVAGVLSLIDWVIRLVPLEGRARMEVLIENRDSFTEHMDWRALARDALRRLAFSYPDRARWIDLDIRIMGKNGSPFNGYVDALAFTWGSPTEASKARLKATQLSGTCLLEGDAESILRAWEWLDRGVTLRGEDWSRLVAEADAKVQGGLTATVLQRLGEACRQDTVLWQGFVNETRQHLDSKAIRLNVLGRQIDWLENYKPADTRIPDRLRLLWLTSRLAHANHKGYVEQAWMEEIQGLSHKLMEEDAPLVCWADLHLAVNATNRYDFDMATLCLGRWMDVPRSVPGSRYYGQWASSMGQHSAFINQPEPARSAFHSAIDTFGQLSDEEQRRKEIKQTSTYLAIVEIDHGDDDSARKAVEQVTGDVSSAI